MSRNVLVSVLEDGRQDVVASLQNLADDLAAKKPAPGRWSALECMEHIVVVEERFLGWLANGSPIEAVESREKEAELGAKIRDRSYKAQAPEAVIPTGRFTSVQAAIDAFNRVRDLSVRVAEERGGALFSVGVTHPRFGDMNGAELVHVLTAHACRHAAQIREIRSSVA